MNLPSAPSSAPLDEQRRIQAWAARCLQLEDADAARRARSEADHAMILRALAMQDLRTRALTWAAPAVDPPAQPWPDQGARERPR